MKSRASAADPPRRAPPRAAKSRPAASSRASPRNAANRRATRSATTRSPRPLYREDDDSDVADESSDESDESNDFAASSRASKRGLPSTASRNSRSAAKRRRLALEDAEDDELGLNDGAYLSPPSNDDLARNASTSALSTPAKRKTSVRTGSARNPPSKPTPRKHKPAPAYAPADAPAEPIPEDKIIPAWSTLPYLILKQIFIYASAPLNDISDVRWLLAMSRLCRSFAEPALTALYKSPPILAMSMAHNLATQLETPPLETMFNYRQKIESLCIEVGAIATHTYKGRHLDINAIFTKCPRLVHLDLYHHKDEAPYRRLDDNLKWTYPPALLAVVGSADSNESGDAVTPRLQSWRWNQRMMGRDMSFSDIKALHALPCLNGLRHVTFVNYQRPSLRARIPDDPEVIAQDQAAAEAFAGCLSVLPNLNHLTIETSTVANEMLLPLLPKQLRHLELVNCWDVTAEHFASYLLTHGRQLRYLTLNHNQSLSLEFLPILREACPDLRALRMDLMYYNHHEFYNDSNPLYDALLDVDQVPAWPSSIETIELEQLRKWDAAAAEMFFQSLVDSAPDLSKLRRLSIKAMLDIPWRQRSEIRDKWVARLGDVFQRKTEPPKSIHSLRVPEPEGVSTPTRKRRSAEDFTPSRRSSRIATGTSRPSSRGSSIARDLRRLDGEVFSYREPDSDEGLAESDLEADDLSSPASDGGRSALVVGGREREQELFVHGMCEVVDIRFDNQKPREAQFGMDDFLDSEDNNSDDEWTGDNHDDDVDYAW